MIINAGGTVIENNRTLPYGEAWLAENPPSTNDKKFTTYQRDQESGLDYAMNRYFGNVSGRFSGPDQGAMTLFLPLSLNRYVYGMNDPVNHTDPDGNDPNNCRQTPDGMTTCYGTRAMPPRSPDWITIDSWSRQSGELVYQRQVARAERDQRRLEQNLNIAYSLALNALLQNPGCAGMFNTSGNGLNPATLLSALYSVRGSQYGGFMFAEIPSITDEQGRTFNVRATTEGLQRIDELPDGSRVNLGVVAVIITLNERLWNNGTNIDRAVTLLHELGHAFNQIRGAGGSLIGEDGRNPQLSLQNSANIRDNCFGGRR